MKMRLVSLLSFASILGLTCSKHIPGEGGVIESRHEPLQNLVTYDEHSILIRGERLFLYSGEFHPFRLPVPGLWLDIFQKIKSLGFNGVSFYVDWALVEGRKGRVNLDGIWDLRPFFDAATEAGIYLIARPGPYINAETSAGGFPGWTLRIPCRLRSTCSEYEEATNTYVAAIGKLIADAQITNGGPVILVQPENEYSSYPNVSTTDFPSQMNKEYIEFVNQQLRDAGIVVPLINNDNLVLGSFAPGTGLGEVDIYGIDAYPVRYDCSQPTVWPTYRWPTNWQILHQQQSPSTPFMIPEFQGGTGTSWGNVGQDMCAALVGPEALRVFYKNNYSFGVKILNIYMTYGGTNWGNLGYMGGDTSYDYGASITEDRHVWREKFSEQKLQANFFRVSPAYLTATPGNATNGTFASTKDVSTTPLFGQNGTNFYVLRHADFTSTADTSYALTLSTSLGNVTIPQLGGQLMLMGRDSKLIVTDYDVGGVNLIYSTADIFTWAKSMKGNIVLIMYGTIGELHEFALPTGSGRPTTSMGSSAKIEQRGDSWVVQWTVTQEQQLVRLCKAHLEIRLLWRNDAFNYWTPELSAPEPIGNFSSPSKSFTIIKGGYLLRTATIQETTLVLTGDFNSTTDLELVHEPTGRAESMVVNGKNLVPTRSDTGNLVVTVDYDSPSLELPDFAQVEWKSIDSMPELASEYNDSAWTSCNNASTTNNQVDLVTPTSLYASDYGYHSGSLIYRGHFISNGNESNLFLNMSGGWSFAYSAFLNTTFMGSWIGSPNNKTYAQTLELSTDLVSGQPYVFTVLMDFMGLDEEAPGTDAIKFPSGILDYSLSGHEATDVSWKITGNLGGEDYIDLVRGPRNEGGMFVERQGYHLPEPPSDDWPVSSPIDDGLDKPGVVLYTTTFDIHIPEGYDVPLSFVFANDTDSRHYRVQLFVNGYQYGKFIPYLGPEFAFPVPEGILNYDGPNYLALTLWALDAEGAQLGGLRLEPQMPVWSGMRRPELSPQPAWKKRPTAY